MATITQTIKIETEGADKAADEFKAIGVAAEKSAQQGTDGFEKFNAAAAKIGSTAQEAGAAFGELGQPIAKMGEAFSSAAPAMSQFKQAAVGAADGLKGIVSAFQSTTQAGQGIAVVTSGISKIGAAAQTAATSAGTLGVALQAGSAALGPFGKDLGALLPTLTAVGLALTTFAAAIPLVTSALGFATPALVAFAAAIGPIGLAVIGITIALGALAAAFYFAAGGSRANDAALKELSGSTGQSVESLKRQQDAFVAAGGSAEGYTAALKNAAGAQARLAEATEKFKSDTENLLHAQKARIEAAQELERQGGPRVSFEDNARLIEINRQLAASAQPAAQAARTLEQALIAQNKAAEQLASSATDKKIAEVAAAFEQANNKGTATKDTLQNLIATLDGIPAGKVAEGLKIPEAEIEKIRRLDAILKDTTQKPVLDIFRVFELIDQALDSVVAMIRPKAEEIKAPVDAAVTTPAPGAWSWISETFNSAAAQVDPAALTAPVNTAVTTPNPSAFQWVVDAWNAMLQKLGFGGGGSSAAPAGASVPGAAGGGLLGGRGSGTSDSNLAWVSRGEYIVPARVVRQPGMLALLEALRLSRFAGGGSVGPGGIPAFAGGGLVGAIENMARNVAETLNRVAEVIDRAFIEIELNLDNALGRLGQSIDDAFRGLVDATWNSFEKIQNAIEGRAGGGLLGGRGTGTSDSNLAWVSRGEYVVPARAVAQPGVLAFLEALRLGGVRGFALGGLVAPTLSLPAFAGGGAMNNVTIQFPGLPEITGLRASSGVVDELRKAAAMAQVRSGGRKPSRYS